VCIFVLSKRGKVLGGFGSKISNTGFCLSVESESRKEVKRKEGGSGKYPRGLK
jgi:hypothetical protein